MRFEQDREVNNVAAKSAATRRDFRASELEP
jgi:hypothetical protein